MNWIREGILALLAALWIAGLLAQLGTSFGMALAYVVISLGMAALVFGNRMTLRLAPRRNRRR
jgi:hypothetical protein